MRVGSWGCDIGDHAPKDKFSTKLINQQGTETVSSETCNAARSEIKGVSDRLTALPQQGYRRLHLTRGSRAWLAPARKAVTRTSCGRDGRTPILSMQRE